MSCSLLYANSIFNSLVLVVGIYSSLKYKNMVVVVTTSLRMTNRLLSKLKSKVSCGDHKKT